VKFSANPVTSTNQFLLENVSHVVKEKQQNASNQCQIKYVNKANNKNRGGSMPKYKGV